MKITGRRERTSDQWGGDLVVEVGRRWVRLALYVGTPPGSHIGVWRTKWGPLRGVNVRVGRRYAGPCVTAFVHTQRRELVA